jgi:hypothetical protein
MAKDQWITLRVVITEYDRSKAVCSGRCAEPEFVSIAWCPGRKRKPRAAVVVPRAVVSKRWVSRPPE